MRNRHKYEIEACLLYLKEFMKVLDSKDVGTVQEFRSHRNEIAHELPNLIDLKPFDKIELLKKVDKVLFKLSNHNTYMQIGSDPRFRGIDWETTYGDDYALFKQVIENVESLKFVNKNEH